MIPPPALQERAPTGSQHVLETLQVLDAKHRGKQVVGMKYSKPFVWRLVINLAVGFFSLSITSIGFAQESALNSQEIDRKLSHAESKVSELNAVYTQIRAKNSEIQAELQSLKIWIRRNRG